jgi:hypothetical protein
MPALIILQYCQDERGEAKSVDKQRGGCHWSYVDNGHDGRQDYCSVVRGEYEPRAGMSRDITRPQHPNTPRWHTISKRLRTDESRPLRLLGASTTRLDSRSSILCWRIGMNSFFFFVSCFVCRSVPRDWDLQTASLSWNCHEKQKCKE